MRRIIKVLGLVMGAGLVLLFAGTLVPRPLFSESDSDVKSVEILVITNPIHTDIAIPANSETLQLFGFLSESGLPLNAPGVRWIVFGWGGRDFYTQTPTFSDMKLVPVLKALTLDRSVLHVELAGEIDPSLPNIKSIPISIPGSKAIYSKIAESFDSRFPAALEVQGYGQNDRFYDAKGGFNVLLGCNTWAARMLRTAGLQTGFWNPLPQSLGLSLDLHN